MSGAPSPLPRLGRGAPRWRLLRAGEGESEHRQATIFVALFAFSVAASHWCLVEYGTIFFWPANGVLVAALLLLRQPAALKVLLVCFLINLAGNILRDSPLHMVVVGAALNMAESLAAAMIARRYCGAALDLRRPKRLAAFVFLAVGPTCAIAALIGIAALGVPWHEFAIGWQTWLAADAIGLVIVTPLLLLAAADRDLGNCKLGRLIEPALLLALLTGTTFAVFLQSRAPLEFLIFLPVLLIAFRLPPVWSALGVLIVAVIGMVATLSGYGPMTLGMLGPEAWDNQRILRALQTLPAFQIFMIALIAVALPSTTVLTERRLMAARLQARTASAIAARKRIAHLAMHDPESDLPNRAGLAARMAGMNGCEASVIAFGIDRFDGIRAAIGSSEAARLLARVAGLIGARVPVGSVALLSSDTIGLAVPAKDQADADQAAELALSALCDPIAVGAEQIDIRLTAGLAAGDEAPARLIERAMIALDQARLGQVRAAWFDAEAERAAAGGLTMLSELRAAVDSGRVHLAHQPKLDLRSGRIAGVECLIRWNRKGQGAVPPDRFMPLVEETGFIEPLTDWVLATALRERPALGGLPVAINLSARSLSEPGLARRLAAIVIDAGQPTCDVTLEMTETGVMGDPTTALATLGALKEAGFRIAIDDYGTGLSSLAYLHQMPADDLKIDRSFVSGIARDARGAELVRSTIELAHRLGLKVVAEGVEEQAELDLLALFGCDEAQGFWIGRPARAGQIGPALADWQFQGRGISTGASTGVSRSSSASSS